MEQATSQRLDQSMAYSPSSGVTPLVSLLDVWKVFAGVPVLKGINLNLMPGEIHALLGGNGSGKSTTMKVLSGVYTPEAGEIRLFGRSVTLPSPIRAHELGVYMIPQEPHIFPNLSVRENLLLGMDLAPEEALKRIRILADEIGFDSDLQTAAGALSIANQQLLEIIRGLLRDAKVLILDEPTSSLTFREVKNLFERMRTLAARGIGLFFVSHRLNEVLEISDRVSVLREGVFVLSGPTRSLTSTDLVRAMVPENTEESEKPVSVERQAAVSAKTVLEVKHLSSEVFRDMSLHVQAGEVVGLAGLVGAGRTEVAEAIMGLDPHAKGEVLINGQRLNKRDSRKCQELGLVYVPEDRHAHGIFLDLPALYTMTATVLPQFGRYVISTQKERSLANQYVEKLSIKMNSLYQIARTLSGGNQQKVVLAKSLASKPEIIIMDEPTRGIDVSARQDVYRLIRDLTAQGVGILLISSELEEVVALSDRVMVMYQGHIIKELDRSEAQLDQVMAFSFGMTGEQSL